MKSPEECQGLWTVVPDEHWEDFRLTEMATGELFADREHTWPEPYEPRLSKRRYWALRVHMVEVEREWRKPRPATKIPYKPTDWMA